MRTREEIQADIDRLNEEMKALDWKPSKYPAISKAIAPGCDRTYPFVIASLQDWEMLHEDGFTFSPATREEALALVDEPAQKTRYDWSKAPEWAQWAATDKDGTSWWYSDRPKTAQEGWYTRLGNYNSSFPKETPSDWRDSLERRPEGI